MMTPPLPKQYAICVFPDVYIYNGECAISSQCIIAIKVYGVALMSYNLLVNLAYFKGNELCSIF